MNYNDYQDDSIGIRMLEFAKRHKLPIILSSVGALLLAGAIAILSRPCKYANQLHQHYYILERDGYRFEKGSELEFIWGWRKSDEVTFNDVTYKYDKANNKGLFSIEENREELAEYERNNQPYRQYKYWYLEPYTAYYIDWYDGTHTSDSSTTINEGEEDEETHNNKPVTAYRTAYDWSNSPYQENQTGEQQIVTKFYNGIRIDANGNDDHGPWVDSVDKIDKDKYPYMDYVWSFETRYLKPETYVDTSAYQTEPYQTGAYWR